MKRIFALYLSLLTVGISCDDTENRKFTKVSSTKSGIDFSNELISTPNLNILNYLYYYNGAGVIAGDFNNDQKIDLYFTGNQISDELYLNEGNFKFQKITQLAEINNSNGWTTGASHVDINNDGLLDIYICKASGYRSLKGQNLLYVNQGINENGVPYFKEMAEDYGLDFEGLSTHAAFFDYDLDGDLDMFLLNHSVHPNRNYGRGTQRKKVDSISGDRLYQNQNGHFKDVSSEAQIFQGKSGYGLGLSISDINNDGYPDIYVGNDFFENDYLYINQRNGTFIDVISSNEKKLGHTTHFSMGNDIADINNDGLMDIISLDMLPENLVTYKTSGLEYPYPIYRQYLNQGFAPQYMQNTLHLNLQNETFAEIGNLAGISATEWSWSALLADFDNDGFNDAFITNGIKGATNDMDYMNFIANEDIQRRIDAGMQDSDMPLVNELPEKKVPNYFFKNNGDLTFTNSSKLWLDTKPSFSNGATYADLDNDGDLDIIVNNINEEAFIFKNNSKEGNHISIKLNGNRKNPYGIGTKITAYTKSNTIYREHFNSRGYLSSNSNSIHLGLGKDSIIDSLRVIWPNGLFETVRNVPANQNININQDDANLKFNYDSEEAQQFLTPLDSVIDFTHKEQVSLDFDREPLIPFARSNQGPDIAVADVNRDGLDDLFITGGKRQSSRLYLQSKEGSFTSVQEELFIEHELHEDVTSSFFDADSDGDMDLLVASGGNEFSSGKQIQPRLYLNENGTFKYSPTAFNNVFVNASKIITCDFDNDNDQDVLITADIQPLQFGKTPKQYVFENDGQGNFENMTKIIAPELEFLGNITDLICIDLNKDGLKDFIVAGHWMPISIFMNTGTRFKLQTDNNLSETNGWWNSIKVDDIDNDGDMDIIAGNWGTNTKFKASEESPLKLYLTDFDDNGSIEPLVTYNYNGTETPFASKDELVKQMPFLNKNFLSYDSFANATLQELFGKSKLDGAEQKMVFELRSCYFENKGEGTFLKKELPKIAQASSIYDMAIEDFNDDGFNDLLIVGNNYEISTQLGRLDALHGVILQNDKNGGFFWNREQKPLLNGAARSVGKIEINGRVNYIIGINSGAPVFLAKMNKQK